MPKCYIEVAPGCLGFLESLRHAFIENYIDNEATHHGRSDNPFESYGPEATVLQFDANLSFAGNSVGHIIPKDILNANHAFIQEGGDHHIGTDSALPNATGLARQSPAPASLLQPNDRFHLPRTSQEASPANPGPPMPTNVGRLKRAIGFQTLDHLPELLQALHRLSTFQSIAGRQSTVE